MEKYEPYTINTTFPPVGLPDRFRGFNLLGKFDVCWSNKGFEEENVKLISQFGFNFVRLPLDYRTYTKKGDWLTFEEKSLFI